MIRRKPKADICLILEGAYPFIAGGVSSWAHELIQAQHELKFHVVALSADASRHLLIYRNAADSIDKTRSKRATALSCHAMSEGAKAFFIFPRTHSLRRDESRCLLFQYH